MLGKQNKKIILQIKKIALTLFFFFLGFYHFAFLNKNNTQTATEKQISLITISDNYDFLLNADKNYSYMEIFLKNMCVGFFMSIIGFFSGGIITVLILYWNGFLLATIIFIALKILPITDIVYYLKHTPTEIFAFALFSSIGFRGFFFYKKIFYKEETDNNLLPKPLEFVLPTILLFISSIIEVL